HLSGLPAGLPPLSGPPRTDWRLAWTIGSPGPIRRRWSAIRWAPGRTPLAAAGLPPEARAGWIAASAPTPGVPQSRDRSTEEWISCSLVVVLHRLGLGPTEQANGRVRCAGGRGAIGGRNVGRPDDGISAVRVRQVDLVRAWFRGGADGQRQASQGGRDGHFPCIERRHFKGDGPLAKILQVERVSRRLAFDQVLIDGDDAHILQHGLTGDALVDGRVLIVHLLCQHDIHAVAWPDEAGGAGDRIDADGNRPVARREHGRE